MKLTSLFVFVIFSILGNILRSQNAIYTELYNLNSGAKPQTTAPNRTLSCFDNGVVYSVGARAAMGGNSISIYAFDTKSQKMQIFSIKRTSELKKLFNEQIETIAHLKGKLVIIAFDYIYIFGQKDKAYQLKKKIKNNGSFLKLYTLNSSELLCYVNYQYHPMDEEHQHTWAKLNLENDSLGSEHYFGTENVRFSSLSNEWISTYKGMIAYAHTTDYKILFYNSDFKRLDSIQTQGLKANQNKLALVPDGTDYSMEEIAKISAADDTLLARIEKIYLLDSINLLVIQKQPNTHYLKYDLWKRDGLSWIMAKSQTLPGHYESGVNYSKKNNEITGFYGNYSGLAYAGNNEFYFVYYPFTENPISESFDLQSDYYDVVNDLTRKKQLFYGIKKLKIRAY